MQECRWEAVGEPLRGLLVFSGPEQPEGLGGQPEAQKSSLGQRGGCWVSGDVSQPRRCSPRILIFCAGSRLPPDSFLGAAARQASSKGTRWLAPGSSKLLAEGCGSLVSGWSLAGNA